RGGQLLAGGDERLGRAAVDLGDGLGQVLVQHRSRPPPQRRAEVTGDGAADPTPPDASGEPAAPAACGAPGEPAVPAACGAPGEPAAPAASAAPEEPDAPRPSAARSATSPSR